MIKLSKNFNLKKEKRKMIFAQKKMLKVRKEFINEYVKYINQINEK